MKMSLLIQVWLFVATLYINAGVNEDAKDAIEEANKLSSALELEVSASGCSVKNFQDRGWASGLSVEELWADVHAQVCIYFIAGGELSDTDFVLKSTVVSCSHNHFPTTLSATSSKHSHITQTIAKQSSS